MKVVLLLNVAALMVFAGFTVWTIYAQNMLEDTEYRYVYEKPLLHVEAAIRYDMEGGIFYRRAAEDERVPVVNQSMMVSEDGETFHEIRTDQSGRLITGWYEGTDGKYYYTRDHGWLVTESGEIEGRYYAMNNNGRVYDHEWVEEAGGLCWYEDGMKAALEEDTLLYLAGEQGFYYLSRDSGFARSENTEVLLSDGRRLKYDENGHIVTDRSVTEDGLVYFPVPESLLTAEESKMVPASQLMMEENTETLVSVNHRGYHVEAPENSLTAYMLSYEEGYRAVECDIQFTADGIPVLLHNETINAVARNADGSSIANMVHISNLTYEQVLAYDFGIAYGEQYRGLKITRLDEFLAFCKAYGIHPYLEMKAETVDTQEEADLLMAMVDSYGLRNQVTWISFSSAALQFVMNRDESARVGYLIANTSNPESTVSSVASLRNQGYDAFLDAAFTSSDKLTGLCASYEVPLEVWTVNSESYIRSLSPAISGITTDYLHADEILGY